MNNCGFESSSSASTSFWLSFHTLLHTPNVFSHSSASSSTTTNSESSSLGTIHRCVHCCCCCSGECTIDGPLWHVAIVTRVYVAIGAVIAVTDVRSVRCQEYRPASLLVLLPPAPHVSICRLDR